MHSGPPERPLPAADEPTRSGDPEGLPCAEEREESPSKWATADEGAQTSDWASVQSSDPFGTGPEYAYEDLCAILSHGCPADFPEGFVGLSRSLPSKPPKGKRASAELTKEEKEPSADLAWDDDP